MAPLRAPLSYFFFFAGAFFAAAFFLVAFFIDLVLPIQICDFKKPQCDSYIESLHLKVKKKMHWGHRASSSQGIRSPPALRIQDEERDRQRMEKGRKENPDAAQKRPACRSVIHSAPHRRSYTGPSRARR
jgi:hypothetical protein